MWASGLGAHTFTTLYEFSSSTSGGYSPKAVLVQALNGSLYGTTSGGGANSAGAIFSITRGATLTTEYNFPANSATQSPLVQGTNGYLYGASGNDVFKISPGALTSLYSSPDICRCWTRILRPNRRPKWEFLRDDRVRRAEFGPVCRQLRDDPRNLLKWYTDHSL